MKIFAHRAVFASLCSLWFVCACAARQEPSKPTNSTTTLDSSGAAPSKDGAGVVANCQPFAMELEGPYRYSNNEWGHDKAKGKSEQCLLTRGSGDQRQRGWSWNWPGFDASVFAYPEIEFGWKPWGGGKATDARFPIRLSNIHHMKLNYDVETQATGSYDLAPEVWLISEKPAADSANPKLITTEVMFWMDYADGARPAGKVIATPEFDGVKYELWKEDKIGESANGQGWRLLSFKSPTIQRRGTISIDKMLAHLVDIQLANPNEYVASIEFGNEVMGGSGTTWVKRFDVEVTD